VDGPVNRRAHAADCRQVHLTHARQSHPQYKKAEEEYRRAQTPEEELRCLELMLREIPKHKEPTSCRRAERQD